MVLLGTGDRKLKREDKEMSKRTGALKHVHKYFQRYDGLWACNGYNGCSHFMPRNMAPLPVGQLSICWKCGKSFMMVQYHMEDTHPKCDECMDFSLPDEVLPSNENKQVTRTSIVQDNTIPSNPVQKTMVDHPADCELYIGGDCTCHHSQQND
jgi:hypothetical protein